MHGRVVTGFGNPAMTTLLTELEAQGWSHLFLQGALQQSLANLRCINSTPIELREETYSSQ